MTHSLNYFPFSILPRSIRIAEVGNQLSSDNVLNLRVVDKACKQDADAILKMQWLKAMKNCSTNFPALSLQMAQIVMADTTLNNIQNLAIKVVSSAPQLKALNLFKELADKFERGGAVLPKSLPIKEDQLAELQSQTQEAQKIAMMRIWSRIRKETPAIPQLQTIDEMRTWIDDPKNTDLLKKVTNLDLSSLALTVLPPEIAKFAELESLNLENNALKYLPEEIKSLTQLTSLNLAKNKFCHLPELCETLTKLRFLSLNNNQLHSLPETIGKLTKLEILNLSHNKLNALPETIKQLKKLQRLYLGHNQINSFPIGIQALNKLQILVLTSNQLESIPEAIEFKYLKALKFLYLDSNRLSILPESIGDLKNLQILYLGNNQLSSLPITMINLIKIQSLHLNDNYFNSIPLEILSFQNLTTLNLANNQLVNIPEMFVEVLKQISTVDLQGNPLMIVSEKFLSHSPSNLQDLKKELEYSSISPLAQLYQAIIHQKTKSEIKEMFSNLSAEDAGLIREVLLCFSGMELQETESEFSNMNKFYLAVRLAIEVKFKRLSQNRKDQIAALLSSPNSNPDWLLRNHPLLADAIEHRIADTEELKTPG